jgi:hypothetical protein
MTDDVTGSSSEEPAKSAASEAQQPAVEEMPTMIVTPPAPEEATQTASGEVTLGEMSTVTMATDVANESTSTLPAEAVPAMAPTVQAPPQATPAPTYEHFGEVTEAGQPVPYPDMTPATPAGAQFPASEQAAFYARDSYAPYSAQPGMPYLAQPGAPYPAQPGMPYPAQPGAPVKRRRTLLWVAVAILVVLLIGGGTAFAIVASQRPTNTPTQVLQQFCHGFTTYNAQEIYDTYSAASKSVTSVSQIQQSLDLLKSMSDLVKISACTVGNVQQNGSTATGNITLTETMSLLGSTTNTPYTLKAALILENNAWKIDAAGMTTPAIPTMPAFPTFPPNLLTPTTSS